ncbi:MAG: hypothetical protein GTN80_03700 [Nitrososphaeria archaeon]|nr:hypothetical protein [Nitrososphaeria archaeon]NIQ32736.1 hypothetical protein [Nitrososphaeria archaeon]
MKIVTVPIFNEAHLLPHFLKNVNEVIEPDLIILNEGMFPHGPENRHNISDRFIELYTHNGDGKRSFDIESTRIFASEHENVVLNEMDYGDISTKDAYIQAFTHGIPENTPKTASIFLTEADVFIHEGDRKHLIEISRDLPDDKVLTATFMRFFIAPHVRIYPDKERRIVMKYGDGSLVRKVAADNFLDHYVDRYAIHTDLRVYHYEWIRPGKYYSARRAQFEGARPEALMRWHDVARDQILRGEDINTSQPLRLETDRTIEHPIHIREHPSFAGTH